MNPAEPLTAPNINAVDDPSGHDIHDHDPTKEEAFTTLKASIDAYLEAMEKLHTDPQSLSTAQVDRLFAELDEAHKTWMASSGIKLKPI